MNSKKPTVKEMIKMKLIHIFHFQLSLEDHNLLEKIADLETGGNISKMIVRIFTIMLPFIEKKHLKEQERGSKYKLIDENDNRRSNVQVYLPVGYYGFLKLIHKDLNTFSMGQILREIIKLYFLLHRRYGTLLLKKKMHQFKEKWKIFKRKFRKSGKKIYEMWHRTRTKAKLQVKYGDIYEVVQILIC